MTTTPARTVVSGNLVVRCVYEFVDLYTKGEMTSQNLWPRYDRHFVGVTWHNVWS